MDQCRSALPAGVPGSQASDASLAPLVVDLDGTLIPSDTLMESLGGFLRRDAANLLRLPFLLARGRARLKEAVAAQATPAFDRLPYRHDLIEYIAAQRSAGRTIVLATAAHQTIAQGVARHLGLFDDVIATSGGRNNKGAAKLESIRQRVGPRFVYAGDSGADVPIWRAAEAAVLVNVAPGLSSRVKGMTRVEREFPPDPVGLRDWLKAIRLHQWIKNLLVFVPLLTSFGFTDDGQLLNALLAFLAFSTAASAAYLLNDFGDIEADRMHPRKRGRPFASGRIAIIRGLAVALVLLCLSALLASAVGIPSLLITLAAYVILTISYNWGLKSYVLIDVIALAMLYTLRVLAGAFATGTAMSSWLFAFSVFVFLSLALVKRCAELVGLRTTGLSAAQGRDYQIGDLAVLWPLGVSAGVAAIVVFGLFISLPETHDRYAHPQLLWLVAVGILYWIARLWIKTSRGEMHDDPVVFAVKDFGSRVAIIGILGMTLIAHFRWFDG